MKCSFCEQPLACQACDKPFVPPDAETLEAAYEADSAVFCPECEAPLVCRACGFPYDGEDQEAEGGGEAAG